MLLLLLTTFLVKSVNHLTSEKKCIIEFVILSSPLNLSKLWIMSQSVYNATSQNQNYGLLYGCFASAPLRPCFSAPLPLTFFCPCGLTPVRKTRGTIYFYIVKGSPDHGRTRGQWGGVQNFETKNSKGVCPPVTFLEKLYIVLTRDPVPTFKFYCLPFIRSSFPSIQFVPLPSNHSPIR